MKHMTTGASIAATVSAALLIGLVAGCAERSTTSSIVVAKLKPVGNRGETPVVSNEQPDGAPAGGVGSLVGEILYDGAPPKPGKPASFRPNDPNTDRFCARNGGQIIDESLLVDAKSKGIQNVVVYLVGKAPASTPVPKEAKLFDNRNCMFKPHVLLVRVGQTITVKNSDHTSHNAHAYPLNPLNVTSLKSMIVPGGQSQEFQYAGPESIPIQVGCSIHAWMQAYHMPLDHSFAAVTDKDGRFAIEGLPAGEYKFNVWHERAGYIRRSHSVKIQPGENSLPIKPLGSSTFASYSGPKPRKVLLSSSE